MKNFDREIMITRLIVSNLFRWDITHYAFMTDNELLANYCIMLDAFDTDGINIPDDWEVEF